MSFGELPDLGKIGKRIGKRLRDILIPPVDNGPSKEERLARRLQDGLKCLVYFDNFDEVENWKVEDVDPVQQANTPLIQRAASQIYDHDGPTSRVLLCHDYSGRLYSTVAPENFSLMQFHRWLPRLGGCSPISYSRKTVQLQVLPIRRIFCLFLP